MRRHVSKLPVSDVEPCTKVPTSVLEIASDGLQLLEDKNNKRKKLLMDDPCNPMMTSSSIQVTQPDIRIESGDPIEPDIRMESDDPIEQDEMNMEANKAFVKWAFSNNIPLSSLKSPHFFEACKLIRTNGPYHDPLTSDRNKKMAISELYQEAASYVESVKQSCRIYGCTFTIDMWEYMKMYYITVMAISLRGTILLKSISSPKLPSSKRIEELTSGLIQGIGFENVVQVHVSCGDWLSGFDARLHKTTGVNVRRRSLKSTFADVLFAIHMTEIFEDLYETCRKIFELLHSKLTNPCLMKMHDTYQVIRQRSMSEHKWRFATLKLVLKEEEAVCHMFASEDASIVDPNIAELKKSVEGTVFWEQGSKIRKSIECLSRIVRMIEGSASTLGCIYAAYLRAREATEVFMAEKGSNSLLLRSAYGMMVDEMDCSLYKMGAHLNPRLFYDRRVKLDEGDIDELDCAIGLMVPPGKCQELEKELRDYRALERSIFGEMAVKSIRNLHPRLWWERWGGAVPTLQSIAVKILSQRCSFEVSQVLRNVIQDMHAKEMNTAPAEWQEQLLLRVHSYLMETATTRRKETDSKPAPLDEREDHLDDLIMQDSDDANKDSFYAMEESE